MKNEKTGYELSRQWFDFTMTTKEKVLPVHTALWFWLIELNNKLAWKEQFGLPTAYSMEAIPVGNYRTYKKALDDLIKWGFVKMIEYSRNGRNASTISLVSGLVKNTKRKPNESQTTASIDKPLQTEQTKKTFLGEKALILFEEFKKRIKPDELQEQLLLKRLEEIAGADDAHQTAVINQAIRGKHKDFKALPKEEMQKVTATTAIDTSSASERRSIRMPSSKELQEFFEDHGYTKDAAKEMFGKYCRLSWLHPDGRDVSMDWKEIAKDEYFNEDNKIKLKIYDNDNYFN